MPSLFSGGGAEGWHAPAGRRTCEPRPLVQDGQIRPAVPAGAIKTWDPADRSFRRTTRAASAESEVRPGPRLPTLTPAPPQNRGSRAGSTTHTLPAEYEREDYQARALLEMRILANSVSGQAAEPAATVAGRIGGHDTPTGGGQRAGRVRLGGDLSANGGSGRLRDVNDNRHSRGDGWAAGQPAGALEEAGLAVSSRAGRSEGGVDGADRAGAVAHREDQRLAGLERQRAAAQLSPGRAERRAVQLGAGEHEAVVIDGDVLEPAGGGGGAYKAEQAPAWLVAAGSVVARRCGVHGDGLKVAAAVQRGDLRGGAHGYPGMGQDAAGEVGGHAGGQVIAVHDQGDGVAASGEIQRRLAGGVRPADDRDRVRAAGPGLQLGRREIDARALELRPPVERQGSVAGAGGDDHCPGLDGGVVGQRDSQPLVGGVQPGSLAGACDTGAEFLCLHRGAAG